MRIIIIGAGPGGYETAVDAAKRGMEVTLITDGELGGTCLNEGCIPTKTFVHYAENNTCLPSASLNSLQERKREVISQLQAGIESLLRNKLITLVKGHAHFISNDTVAVGDTQYTADHIIIATGSESTILPIKGSERCLTSKEMLELREIPKSLCVIGGGVIGLEFANIFNKLGSEVSILEYCPQILPHFDTDLCKRVKQHLTKQGINIQVGYKVEDIDAIEAETVLMSVGRHPNVDGLGLENTSVEYSKRGITVDDNMQTSVPSIYAIGDVNTRMMLAHVATFQGRHALNHIEGKTDNIRFDIVPSAVFITPEVATVGLTEEDCKERGIKIKAHKSFFRANGKAVSMGETDGYFKLLSDEESGRILGAHMFGAHSSDIIHEIAALMNMQATVSDLHDMIHAHPTLAEVVQNSI